MDFTMTFYTINGEFRPGCAVDRWCNELKAFLWGFRLEPEPGPRLEGWIRAAGFEDIHIKRFALPVGLWPKEKRMVSVVARILARFLSSIELVVKFLTNKLKIFSGIRKRLGWQT
jgi:hypothetical protein